jgi:hypothetical protein
LKGDRIKISSATRMQNNEITIPVLWIKCFLGNKICKMTTVPVSMNSNAELGAIGISPDPNVARKCKSSIHPNKAMEPIETVINPNTSINIIDFVFSFRFSTFIISAFWVIIGKDFNITLHTLKYHSLNPHLTITIHVMI